MLKLFRKSEPIQEILIVTAEEIHVGDRFVYNESIEEVVAIWCGDTMMHVILRPAHRLIVTLDEYHEELLYYGMKVQVTRFK